MFDKGLPNDDLLKEVLGSPVREIVERAMRYSKLPDPPTPDFVRASVTVRILLQAITSLRSPSPVDAGNEVFVEALNGLAKMIGSMSRLLAQIGEAGNEVGLGHAVAVGRIAAIASLLAALDASRDEVSDAMATADLAGGVAPPNSADLN